MRVLYVEDDERDADLARHELARHAPQIILEVALTLSDARARLAAGHAYDLVLADLRLPDGLGLDLLTEIRGRSLPLAVVILTGQGDEATAVAALKTGADDYVSKREGYLTRLPVVLEAALARFRAEAARRMDALRVLYAEHNAADIDLTRRHLQTHAPHVQLDVVHSSGEVLARLPRSAGEPCPWDVLLLDYRLPGLDALELLKILHDERRLDVPVVLVTGQGDEEVAAQALRLGATDYLVKHPNYLFGLPAALENAHYRARLTREQSTLRQKTAELEGYFTTLTLKNLMLSTQQETSLDAILVVDEQGQSMSFNRQFVELWGIPPEVAASGLGDRALESSVAKLVDPEGFVARVRYLREHRKEKSEAEIALRDGRTFACSSAPMFAADGRYYGRVWYFRDITERKQGEQALKASETRFRALIENSMDLVVVLDAAGRVKYASPSVARLLGYAPTELFDKNAFDYLLPADRERIRAAFARAAAGSAAEIREEFGFRHKDGTWRIMESVVSNLLDNPAVGGLVINSRDVTERRSLENQFRQAQRMEAVGRLAGGVAHDFNNVLTAITGYSDLLLEDLGPEDHKRADVEEIKAAALRAEALTRQLLAFSRKQVLQTRVLDLNGVVQTLDKMLRRLIGEDVKLDLSLSSALGAVRADPGQIEQVILNLAVNSRDAMPNGGSLTIETANVELDEAYTREHAGVLPGRYVMLAVSDTGIGMDAEIRSHIFEPFFTTKEQGMGTGLGLATVYGIVRQSGGYVWVYSEPGRGATFKIYLPQVDELPEVASLPAPVQPVAGGRETVLLAEDDASVRAVVSDVLAQKGYRVLRAPDGQAALEMARAQQGVIHLLVTDIVMPGMTGRELAEALTAERPGLRVLYMSGYTDDAVVRHGVLDEGMPYLQKPFAPRALAFKVREVLDRT
jgi:two-component system cell cycle sensor histidine kinase/response regulator CckA